MTSEQTANTYSGLTVTWHFVAATVFVFLSTMLAGMAVPHWPVKLQNRRDF